eukprot:3766683-Amphidinium_carterae.2
MAMHSAYYAKLPQEVQQQWERQAHILRAERRHKLDASIVEATAALDLAILSLDQAQDQACAGGVKQCAWSHDELQAAANFQGSLSLTNAQVKTMRDRSLRGASPCSGQEFEDLLEKSLLMELTAPPVTGHTREIAYRRQHLKDSVCGVVVDDVWSYYKLVFASLNPLYVVWTPLRLVDVPVDTHREATWFNMMENHRGVPCYTWVYDPDDALSEDIFEMFPTGKFWIWHQTQFTGTGMITSDDTSVSLEEFIRYSHVMIPATTDSRPPRKSQLHGISTSSESRFLDSLMQLGQNQAQIRP